MTFTLAPEDVHQLVAVLGEDTPDALREWSLIHLETVRDMRACAVACGAIGAALIKGDAELPEGAAFVPDLADAEGRTEADAQRYLIMHLNGDAPDASGLLRGVYERGDLEEFVGCMLGIARSAVAGNVEFKERG